MHLQLKALHQYDCLRANKATSAWGLEARVPFLDKEFLNVAMSIDPEWKLVRLNLYICIFIINDNRDVAARLCKNYI